jgi:hypothetical protein
MKTISFDFKLRKDIQSEENGYKGRYKVQTREGNPARIICWNRKDDEYPIVALVEAYSIEVSLSYRKNGMYNSTDSTCEYDLLLVDTWEPKFELWDRIVNRGITFDIVSIDYASKKYGVVSDSPYTDICRVTFDDQDGFELVKPLSGFNYNEGTVMRCAEGPNKGSLWLRCSDKLVKSDGVTFSPAGRYSEGLYYPANRKETDLFFAELDENGYKYSPVLGAITKKPKFKIGDGVRYKNGDGTEYKIVDMLEASYRVIQSDKRTKLILFDDDDHLEIAPANTAKDFKVGQVLKCLSTGHLWLNRDGDCLKSDGHTVSIGGTYEAASQEESDKFFKELDENGYIWNPEKRKVEKKEPELTDFEQEVRDIVTSALTVTSEDGSCSLTVAVDDKTARKIAVGINKLVTKKLFHERF